MKLFPIILSAGASVLAADDSGKSGQMAALAAAISKGQTGSPQGDSGNTKPTSGRINFQGWPDATDRMLDNMFKDIASENGLPDTLLDSISDERHDEDVKNYRSTGNRYHSQIHLLSKYNVKDEFFRIISRYGCWCTFKSDFAGIGIPVDKFDRTCKQLNEAYECASDEIRRCKPWQTEFNVPARAYKIESELEVRAKCEKANRDANSCVVTSCQIQVQFVLDTFAALYGGAFDFRNRHDMGFNPKKDCHMHAKHNLVDRQCCGSWPKRTIYNSALRECCADGKARLVC